MFSKFLSLLTLSPEENSFPETLKGEIGKLPQNVQLIVQECLYSLKKLPDGSTEIREHSFGPLDKEIIFEIGYYPDGNIKSEGSLIIFTSNIHKIGLFKFYRQDGTLEHTEKYSFLSGKLENKLYFDLRGYKTYLEQGFFDIEGKLIYGSVTNYLPNSDIQSEVIIVGWDEKYKGKMKFD